MGSRCGVDPTTIRQALMHQKTLTELAIGLEKGEFSSVELTQHYLDRATAHASLNSFITVTPDLAISQATAADARRASGDAGPLTGLPLAHKDLFCTEGVRTSCGSKMLDNFISPFDATVVSKLGEAGMVTVGKANMDEFAMGSSNENSFYGAVQNPWATDRVPGGSSGGSAAMVAARLVPAATATDTGGSIRQPASFCGVTGIKPTYGRVSRYGMVAYASSLDQGGVIAATAEDCAMVLGAMSGHDAKDSTSIDRPVEDYRKVLGADIAGLRVGIPKEYFGEGLSNAVGERVLAAAKELEALGAVLVDVSLPNTELAISSYYVVAPAEASSNLSRFDGVRYGHRCEDPKDLEDLYKRSRGEGLGKEVQRRIMVGAYVLSAGYYDAYYLKAQKLRRLIAQDFTQAFEQCDLIVGPVAPTTAFKIGELSDDPVAMYLADVYTLSTNLAGLPGISMPVGLADGLPVGAQLLGPHFSEARLLNVAHQFQQQTDWHQKIPAAFA